MVALPELHPVIQTPWFRGTPPWPWPIADRKPFSFVRLSGQSTEAEVGSFIAQLVSYNRVEAESTLAGLVAGVVAAESLVLPGGVQASAGEYEIGPSCCCGLEQWRDWLECLESGDSPWMGHDPSPWVEWADGIVRVWADRGLDPAAVAIDFERGRFVAELGRVGRELRAFLPLVEEWARSGGFPDPPALSRKLDAYFGITGPVAADSEW